MSDTNTKTSNRNINVTVTCAHCGTQYSIAVNEIDMLLWLHKETKIQDAFPYLNADERELFLSRTCANCWNEIFKPDEDE